MLCLVLLLLGVVLILASDASSWFSELADANATLPIWLLLVFLTAGLTGVAVGLASLLAG